MSITTTQPDVARRTTLLQFGFVSQQPCEQAICVTPQPVQIPGGIADLVSGGWGSPHVIAADGKLYCWGSAQQNSTFTVAEDVTYAAVGWDHAVCVRNGTAFVLELDKPGACQHELDLHGQAVTAVAAGEHHSLLLATSGNVYCWPAKPNTQLGITDQTVAAPVPPSDASRTESLVASLIPLAQPIMKIACGARHSVAISSEGLVFCWGWGLHGQCGQGIVIDNIDSPCLVTALAGLKASQVAAGTGHTVATCVDGSCYSWGWNADGQLGHGSRRGCLAPKLIESEGLGAEEDVVRVSAGSRHSLLLTSSKKLFSFGCNDFGQLGLGNHESADVPMMVMENVADIAAGWWHSLALAAISVLAG